MYGCMAKNSFMHGNCDEILMKSGDNGDDMSSEMRAHKHIHHSAEPKPLE